MARTVDPVRHEERRLAILDAAAHLIRERGVGELTIADVLRRAGISKGALYHYYSGKDELLTALIARRLDAWNEAVVGATDAVSEPSQRLIALVRALTVAKSEDLPLLVSVLPTLQSHGGALMHARLRAAGRERFLPLITGILREGARTGAFRAPTASSAATVIMSLLQEMAECIARGLLSLREGSSSTESLRADAQAYAAAIPAVLGSSIVGSDILGPDDLDDWIQAAQQLPASRSKEQI